MSEFAVAVDFVLEREGGLVDSENDSGGVTNFGISLRFLQNLPMESLKKYGIFGEPTGDDIKALTLDRAREIYYGEFWLHAPFGAFLSQRICNYVFDMAVNHGIGQAIKILQRATWAVTSMYGFLADDGVLGDATLHSVNNFSSDKYFGESLKAAVCAERAGFCRLLAEVRPKDKENLHGWLERCYSL